MGVDIVVPLIPIVATKVTVKSETLPLQEFLRRNLFLPRYPLYKSMR